MEIFIGCNSGFGGNVIWGKQIWWNVFAARLGFVLAFQVRLKHLNLKLVAVGFLPQTSDLKTQDFSFAI